MCRSGGVDRAGGDIALGKKITFRDELQAGPYDAEGGHFYGMLGTHPTPGG